MTEENQILNNAFLRTLDKIEVSPNGDAVLMRGRFNVGELRSKMAQARMTRAKN